MAVLTIRNLPDDVHRKLRVRAAHAGRSMEAEARSIVTEACAREATAAPANDAIDALEQAVKAAYRGRKPRRVVEGLIRERRREAKRE